MNKNLRLIVTGGLLVALDVVCTRFLFFYTPGAVDRISLQFLPNALAGLLFGPVWGMAICVLGDTVGMIINSGGMSFMPLITMACGARGIIYGLILHRKPVSFMRSVIAVGAVTAIVELGLMPLFLSILYGRAWSAILIGKLFTRVLTIPAYGAVLYVVARSMSHAGIANFTVKHQSPRK